MSLSRLLILLLLLGMVWTGPVQAQSAQDVVVVVLDDMKTSDWVALPKTQQLLADGTWFPHFILTSPVCCPSRINILSGLYGHTTGVVENRVNGISGWIIFADSGREERTVAAALQSIGYRTGLFGKYLNAHPNDRVPRGWNRWVEGVGYTDPNFNIDGVRHKMVGHSPILLAERAARFSSGDGPRFTYYAPYPPHGPSIYEEKYADRFPNAPANERDRLRSLLSADDGVEMIAAAMGERWHRACIMVMSDNGHLLGEDGHTKGVPYDIAIRVPMLTRGCGIAPGTDNRIIGNIDVAPTIMDITGVNNDWVLDGQSFAGPLNRDGILIQGGAGGGHLAWIGIRTTDHTYVEWSDGSTDLWEWQVSETDDLLTPDNAAAWDSWLDTLRDCRGPSCWDNE